MPTPQTTTHNALDVARYVINTCNDKRIEITNLKLQKILYFIQANFLVEEGKACFYDEIEAWDFGPVVPTVYREFKCFGSLDIPYLKEYYEYNHKTLMIVKKEYTCIFNNKEKAMIDDIINQCSKHSLSTLTKTTLTTPWAEARTHLKPHTISTKSIKKYFQEANL